MSDEGPYAKGKKVLSRDGKLVGQTTGSKSECRLEGCCGWRLGVRWSGKKVSFPCTKGMSWETKTRSWRIL